jgi:hypothetical protein
VKQRFCACGKDITKLRRKRCVVCAHKLGLCTICQFSPQDQPGFKTCLRCRRASQRQLARIEARTGIRNFMPEWQVRQIEECQAAATAIHKEFVETKCQ